MKTINHCVSIKEKTFDSEIRPKVSVAIIAYNLEDFIEEALDSVLMQITNFDVEIVIGEDCSKDNTLDILRKYEAQYPGLVRLLAHEKNLGLTKNSHVTQSACRGEYIALLDGDDYWTTHDKLQRQVDFMESNPEFSAVSHQATYLYEDGSPSHLFGETVDQTYSLDDTLTHRKFHTSSLLYRSNFWFETGGFPVNISSNERALYPMIAMFGPIKYFKESMCVYRLSSINLSSRITYKELESDINMLPWFKSLDSDFPIFKFRSFLHLCIYTYGKKPPFFPLLKHFLYFCLFSFSYFPKNLKDLKWGGVFFLRRAVKG